MIQVRNGAENDEEKSVGNDENTANAKIFMFNSRRSMLFPALLFCPDCHVVPCRCFRLWSIKETESAESPWFIIPFKT